MQCIAEGHVGAIRLLGLGCNELPFPDREGPTSGHGGVVGQKLAKPISRA